VTQNITAQRGSNIDSRTTRHAGYQISQVKRRMIEQIFGWFKGSGGGGRSRFRGLERTRLAGFLVVTAYNLLRMSRLMPQTG
jgi:IS5 family transposase